MLRESLFGAKETVRDFGSDFTKGLVDFSVQREMDGDDELVTITMTNARGETENFRLDKEKKTLVGDANDYPASEDLIRLLEK